MCSVPELPTPGPEVAVLIKRVNLNPSFGLIKLWVNMDDGKKHIYERLREEIQIPDRKLSGSEGKPGDLCLVWMSDTWHRAQIVSIQSKTYNVFLIDQGQSHIATSEALAWGNSDSFVLPPEIECCILANVLSLENNWPEKATKFLKSLPGKKFKGLVQHVLMPDRTILLDLPIISKHLCKFGAVKKISGDAFKLLVLKYLHLPEGDVSQVYHIMQEQNLNINDQLEEHGQYFYPALLTDTYENVIVTEALNPNNFFCKLLIFSKAVKILSEQLEQHYEVSSDFGEAQPQTCGEPCAARGIHGRWYRSLLKQNIVTGDDAVAVLHVDEGKTEVVPVGDIRPLHGKFLRMPVVTYLCSLDGVKDNGTGWTTDQTDYLKSLLLNQAVIARFDHHNVPQDVYHVTVYTATAGCVNDCFTEKTAVLPHSKTEQDSDVENEPIASSLSSLEDEKYMDWNKVNEYVEYLQAETLPSTKNVAVSGGIDDVPNSSANDAHVNERSELSDPLLHGDGHLSAGFPYISSTNSIEVGGKEKVWVTSAVSVNHFYCQLDRNSGLFAEMMQNVKQLIDKPLCTDDPLGLDCICLARYCDNQWYRGQIVEMSPKIKVHFVDHGDTLAVNESDIRPFPSEKCIARCLPVQAVPLRLFDVPEEVPQEVNQWFADCAIGHSLTISVVAKGKKGKLTVELFDGSVNVNVEVRERISKIMQQKLLVSVENGEFLTEKHMNVPKNPTKRRDQNKVRSGKGMCDRNELIISSQSTTNVSAPDVECGRTFDEGRHPTLDVILEDKETVLMETFIQSSHSDLEITQLSSCPEGNVNFYKRPNVSQEKTEEVYASCIVGPHYFWCQYANTEDLNKLSRTSQEAGQAQQDMFTETLCPGSPCLALFSSDNQWYRAWVTQRTADTLHVLFVDYGNESDVDLKDVRSLPESLLEAAPQAFLCSLNGFDESRGSWDDCVYDDFYNLLIDKPLRVTVFNTEDHSEIAVPQYAVQIECENVIVNDAMQKYWKAAATDNVRTESSQRENSLQCSETEANTGSKEHAKNEVAHTETFLQGSQTEPNMTRLSVSTGNESTCAYKKPSISKKEIVEVFASVIVDPHFFWCQYANTEDLGKVLKFAQEAEQAQQDMIPETLGPGSPCLALYSSDNQWYRAQVIQRTDDALHVLFVDYGNESDVDIKNVRTLPQTLVEMAPQAFLCSLNGFDGFKGSWDDKVYDDFYNLLIDKPLRVTVFSMNGHSEIAVPQYAVEIECEGVVINTLMKKYWKELDTDQPLAESSESVDQDETRTMSESVGV